MHGVGGDIELMSVSDIALWIAGREATGTLSVRRFGLETRLTIRKGMCVQSASTDPREYLGQHLINFGHINETQLQQAFDTQKETKVPLGRVLVMVDLLSREELKDVLYFKTREGLLEALGWHQGSWRFVNEADADPEHDSERPVDLRDAVNEANSRQQIWVEIRSLFPSDGTRCDVLIDPASIENAFDRRLVLLMSQGRSVGEAALELRAMDFQVYSRLYELAALQALRPVVNPTFRVPRTATPLAETSPLAAALAAVAPVAMTTTTTTNPKTPAPAGPATPAAAPAGAALGRVVPISAPATTPPNTNALAKAAEDLELKVDVVDSGDLDFNVDVDDQVAAIVPAMAPLAHSPAVEVASKATPDEDSTFGTYMMVKKPGEAADNPVKALELALMSRQWGDAVLLAQRILEHDPFDGEAMAALRIAGVQLRKAEKASGPTDDDFGKVPRLAMPLSEIALEHLSSKERYVLSRIDGQRSLAQIAAVSPVQRAELWRIVESFVQRNVLVYG
jgi:hypothetical protein